ASRSNHPIHPIRAIGSRISPPWSELSWVQHRWPHWRQERPMKRALVGTACTLLILGVLGPIQPASATPPTGALLNPSTSDSNGPGTFISNQNDGTDKLFHFAVRAVSTTSGASVTSVRIQIKPPNVLNFQTIGNATQVGSTDTWELKWNQTASGIATGDGSVRAQ